MENSLEAGGLERYILADPCTGLPVLRVYLHDGAAAEVHAPQKLETL